MEMLGALFPSVPRHIRVPLFYVSEVIPELSATLYAELPQLLYSCDIAFF
jgi:hypothetical protein